MDTSINQKIYFTSIKIRDYEQLIKAEEDKIARYRREFISEYKPETYIGKCYKEIGLDSGHVYKKVLGIFYGYFGQFTFKILAITINTNKNSTSFRKYIYEADVENFICATVPNEKEKVYLQEVDSKIFDIFESKITKLSEFIDNKLETKWNIKLFLNI